MYRLNETTSKVVVELRNFKTIQRKINWHEDWQSIQQCQAKLDQILAQGQISEMSKPKVLSLAVELHDTVESLSWELSMLQQKADKVQRLMVLASLHKEPSEVAPAPPPPPPSRLGVATFKPIRKESGGTIQGSMQQKTKYHPYPIHLQPQPQQQQQQPQHQPQRQQPQQLPQQHLGWVPQQNPLDTISLEVSQDDHLIHYDHSFNVNCF